MINANNIEDLTETIQNKKHSELITKDFQKLILLKKQNSINMANSDDFDNICIEQCSFLFTNYTDIYNKIKNSALKKSNKLDNQNDNQIIHIQPKNVSWNEWKKYN